MQYPTLVLVFANLFLGATATPNPTVTSSPNVKLAARASSLPKSSGTSVLKAAQTIAAGESFDGGIKMFDNGVSCTGQFEGGDKDAVFQIEEGGSLSNVINWTQPDRGCPLPGCLHLNQRLVVCSLRGCFHCQEARLWLDYLYQGRWSIRRI